MKQPDERRDINGQAESDTRSGPLLPPLLIGVAEVARLLSTSVTSVWRLLAAGKIPAPVVRGKGRTRWRRREIVEFCDAGLPNPCHWKWSGSSEGNNATNQSSRGSGRRWSSTPN